MFGSFWDVFALVCLQFRFAEFSGLFFDPFFCEDNSPNY